MRNAFINSTNKISPRGKAGLAGLDASTIFPFGQDVVVHNHKIKNKLHPRGITGYTLSPSKESHGYLVYIPANQQIIDTSNFSLVKDSSTHSSINNSIFDDLISLYEQDINITTEDNKSPNSDTNEDRTTTDDDELYRTTTTMLVRVVQISKTQMRLVYMIQVCQMKQNPSLWRTLQRTKLKLFHFML